MGILVKFKCRYIFRIMLSARQVSRGVFKGDIVRKLVYQKIHFRSLTYALTINFKVFKRYIANSMAAIHACNSIIYRRFKYFKIFKRDIFKTPIGAGNISRALESCAVPRLATQLICKAEAHTFQITALVTVRLSTYYPTSIASPCSGAFTSNESANKNILSVMISSNSKEILQGFESVKIILFP